MTPAFRYRPRNVARALVWALFALLMAGAPLLFGSGLSLTLLSQMGIAIVACLSYNMLLGQGGMLSFGHAVYSGLGAYLAIHALNRVAGGQLPLPVSLVPLVGALAGIGVAVLLGFVTTRKSGTPFAMITLGLAELVFAMSLMVPEFFGGEAGVAADRVIGRPVAGISFGPQIQVYTLIALYTFFATAAMFAFTRTPLGRMLNAVRDNPERVGFIGYDAQRVRYLAFIIAGGFAGLSGGLAGLVMMNLRVAAYGRLRPLWPAYLALAGTALTVLAGVGAMIEMVYHLRLEAALGGGPLRFLGAPLDPHGIDSWGGATLVALAGLGLFELTRREFARRWGAVQQQIAHEIRQKEAS
ncbi:MAG: branched-chain amino acid ABC transporter permease [Methylibium sp.]|nr:branched-chain amino acid ABC transporter permease [Methylibium sp.]